MPSIPTGACSGSYGSQVNVNLAVNGTQNFDYTGNVQCAYLQKAGYYKLEVWGAQGGTYKAGIGGYGGYAYGNIYSQNSSSLYIIVGKSGSTEINKTIEYNGGGGNNLDNSAKGGGATHISTVNCGELKNCSSYESNILIVAGGGGGGSVYEGHNSAGGSGGGYIGGVGDIGDSNAKSSEQTTAGNQNSAGNCGQCDVGGFGFGGTNTSGTAGGGGGGWYGGGAGYNRGNAGAGGSGYIGNSLLLSAKGITKQMYMYSTGCTSSTATATKTTCTSSTGHAIANAANTGNGYAKITYLGT